MDKFAKFTVKFSLVLMAIFAVAFIAIGIGILFFPNVILQILRILSGILTLCAGVYLLVRLLRALTT